MERGNDDFQGDGLLRHEFPLIYNAIIVSPEENILTRNGILPPLSPFPLVNTYMNGSLFNPHLPKFFETSSLPDGLFMPRIDGSDMDLARIYPQNPQLHSETPNRITDMILDKNIPETNQIQNEIMERVSEKNTESTASGSVNKKKNKGNKKDKQEKKKKESKEKHKKRQRESSKNKSNKKQRTLPLESQYSECIHSIQDIVSGTPLTIAVSEKFPYLKKLKKEPIISPKAQKQLNETKKQ